MPKFDPSLLRQEVNELTALMRNDANWSELRHALESKGLSPEFIVSCGVYGSIQKTTKWVSSLPTSYKCLSLSETHRVAA